MARTATHDVTVDRSKLVKMVAKAGTKGMSATEVRDAFELGRNRPARVALRAAVKDKELRLIKHGRLLVAVTPDIRKLDREDERTARLAKEDKATKAVAKKAAKTPAKVAKKTVAKSVKKAAKTAAGKAATPAGANGDAKAAKASKASKAAAKPKPATPAKPKPARKPKTKVAKATTADEDADNEDLLGVDQVKGSAKQEEMTEH